MKALGEQREHAGVALCFCVSRDLYRSSNGIDLPLITICLLYGFRFKSGCYGHSWVQYGMLPNDRPINAYRVTAMTQYNINLSSLLSDISA